MWKHTQTRVLTHTHNAICALSYASDNICICWHMCTCASAHPWIAPIIFVPLETGGRCGSILHRCSQAQRARVRPTVCTAPVWIDSVCTRVCVYVCVCVCLRACVCTRPLVCTITHKFCIGVQVVRFLCYGWLCKVRQRCHRDSPVAGRFVHVLCTSNHLHCIDTLTMW